MITRASQQVNTAREKMRGGNGTVHLSALVSELTENVRLFSRLVLAPGASIGYHVHVGETELFYFAQGRGLVSDNGTMVEVQAGDAMSTPNGCGHSVENTGDTNLILIAAIVRD
ncbi:MAG: cupin domain-containing protein [Clostridia bacterium]